MDGDGDMDIFDANWSTNPPVKRWLNRDRSGSMLPTASSSPTAPPRPTADPASPRVTPGLVDLYDFQEQGGSIVHDRAGRGAPLGPDHHRCARPGATGRGGALAGRRRLYVDSAERAAGTVGHSFANWERGYRFALANELTLDRAWLGLLHLVAVYDRALAPDEIARHFRAGPRSVVASHLYLPRILNEPVSRSLGR